MGQTTPIPSLKVWPAPGSYEKRVPQPGQPGSFWEERGDRHHAGVDLYAPAGTPVLAAELGVVLQVEVFSAPTLRPYWNVTWSVLVECADGRVLRYAEMQAALAQPGELLEAGEPVGSVGQVLNLERVDASAPAYIQKLRDQGVCSMLHFEMHQGRPDEENYLGGNYFCEKPENLMDPTGYCQRILGTD